MANFTFSKQTSVKGSSQISVNVDCDHKPFAQIWTFKDTKSTNYPWVAKTLDGEHFEIFDISDKILGLIAAKLWVQQRA